MSPRVLRSLGRGLLCPRTPIVQESETVRFRHSRAQVSAGPVPDLETHTLTRSRKGETQVECGFCVRWLRREIRVPSLSRVRDLTTRGGQQQPRASTPTVRPQPNLYHNPYSSLKPKVAFAQNQSQTLEFGRNPPSHARETLTSLIVSKDRRTLAETDSITARHSQRL